MPVPPSGAVLTNQGPEALVIPLNFRVAPSDSVTFPCADTDLTRRDRDGCIIKNVDQVGGHEGTATSRPTIESLNPLAALLVSASSPLIPGR